MEDVAPLLREIADLLRERNQLTQQDLTAKLDQYQRAEALRKNMEESRAQTGRLEKMKDRIADFDARQDARNLKEDEYRDALLEELRQVNANLQRLYLHQSGGRDVD